VNASDEDVGQSAEITYALADLQPSDSQGQGHGRQLHSKSRRNDGGQDDVDAGLCVEKFYIDSQFGVVTAKKRLDYEQRAIYKCRVLAVDGGEPPNTGQTPCHPDFCVNFIEFFTQADVVAGVGCLSALYVCVYVCTSVL